MKKRNAIITLVVFLIATLGIGYMVMFGVGTEKTGAAENVKLGLDLAGGVSITYQAVGEEKPSAADMSDTIYKLQKRVEGYSTESQVYKEGDDRISIEIPGVEDANAVLEELGKPGSLYFIKQYGPDGSDNYSFNGMGYVLNKSIDELDAEGSIVLNGTDIKTAQAGSTQDDMNNQEFVVELTLNPEGTSKFAEATTEAAVNHDTIMIYYDGAAVSVPSVNSAITGGQAYITGMEDFEAADNLAQTIRIGGLKVELEELRKKAEASGAQEDAQAYNDFANLCNRFEKKLHDLELTRMISIQMGPQTRLLQNNDTQMLEKIQSSLINTIPLWKSQMVLALGIEHGRQATAAQAAVTEMTNDLLKKNADTLKMATIETAKEAERSVVDIETLKHTNEQLISTLDEVMKIQTEGAQKRKEAEAELGRIEGELKQKLLELKSAN